VLRPRALTPAAVTSRASWPVARRVPPLASRRNRESATSPLSRIAAALERVRRADPFNFTMQSSVRKGLQDQRSSLDSPCPSWRLHGSFISGLRSFTVNANRQGPIPPRTEERAFGGVCRSERPAWGRRRGAGAGDCAGAGSEQAEPAADSRWRSRLRQAGSCGPNEAIGFAGPSRRSGPPSLPSRRGSGSRRCRSRVTSPPPPPWWRSAG
jgi:hypothetical protein